MQESKKVGKVRRFCIAPKERRNPRNIYHDPRTGRFCRKPSADDEGLERKRPSAKKQKEQRHGTTGRLSSGRKTRAATASRKEQRAEIQVYKPRALVVINLVSSDSGDEVSSSDDEELEAEVEEAMSALQAALAESRKKMSALEHALERAKRKKK